MNKEELLEEYKSLYGEIDPLSHLKYSAKLLTKTEFVENDIFTIHYKNTNDYNRIGWVFPVFVIGSSNHDLFSKEYFRIYAKIAASFLLDCKDTTIAENSHIMILSDDHLLRENILINDFEIEISKYGYYPCSQEVVYSNSARLVPDTNRKIVVTKTPRIFESKKYLAKLWLEILPSVNDPLARFVSLYQVVEMLIELFFNEKIDEIRNTRTTIGTIRDRVQNYSSEKKIIDAMFSQYALRMELMREEKDIAHMFFEDDKDDQYYAELSLPSFIYDMRNAIIHNYYKYEFSEKMILIAERIEMVIIEILENEKVISLVKLAC